MPETVFHDSLRLLATRRFGTFWFASLVSSIGTWAQMVAQPWLLLGLGASPVLLGVDTFAMSAPMWLLTIPGGMLADHADRRRVIAGFQSAQMLCPILVVALLLGHAIHPWMIILLSLIIGITDALSMPSFASIVPLIVSPRQIGAGLALNATQFNLSRVAGPALAGMLMSGVGVTGCFAASAVSYLPFIGVALWILPRHAAAETPKGHRESRQPLAGLRSIARMPLLRGALLTVFCSGLLCAPIMTFWPVLVANTFHGSAAQYSLGMGAFGVGGVVGAVAMLGIAADRDRRKLSSGFAIAFGLTVMAVALVPWFPTLPLLLVGAGLMMTIANTAANTLLQSFTSPKLMGQAVSLHMLAMRGGMALGSLLTGFSVHWAGVRPALLINGTVAVAVHAFIRRYWLHAPMMANPEPAVISSTAGPGSSSA
jgi:MFS family permease